MNNWDKLLNFPGAVNNLHYSGLLFHSIQLTFLFGQTLVRSKFKIFWLSPSRFCIFALVWIHINRAAISRIFWWKKFSYFPISDFPKSFRRAVGFVSSLKIMLLVYPNQNGGLLSRDHWSAERSYFLSLSYSTLRVLTNFIWLATIRKKKEVYFYISLRY